MLAIENNPGRWRHVPVSLAPGIMWDFHVDMESFPHGNDTDYAKDYLSLVLNVIKYAGGGIPPIATNNLTDNWQQELNEAAEKPLDEKSLALLAAILKDVPIYLTGDNDLCGAEVNVESKIIWTLPPEQFSPHTNSPDLTKVRLLMYVKKLRRIEKNLQRYQTDQKEDLRGEACKVILGGLRLGVHESVHALRMGWVLQNKVFDWIRMNGDWNIPIQQMKSDAATPAKLVGYRYDAKDSTEFPADAGRLWENSVTRGQAVFEGDFCLMGMAVSYHSPNAAKASVHAGMSVREEVLSKDLSDADAIAVMIDPRRFVSAVRSYAEQFPSLCRSGYHLANYVSCSRTLCRCFKSDLNSRFSNQI